MTPSLIILADSPETFRELIRVTVADLLRKETPSGDSSDTLLTMAEACREFGVSKTTLSEWKRKGLVPFVRLGRRIFFERSKVLEAGRTHMRYQHRKQA